MDNKEVSKLSPFELNHAIYREHSRLTGFLSKVLPDYCNNWDDLMPLVDFDYSTTKHATGLFDVVVNYTVIGVVNAQTKQRALAECLLKVLMAKENDNG